MSTDIIVTKSAGRGKSVQAVQLDALRLYVAISLPLMLVTFAAWWFVYWWSKRNEEKRNNEVKPDEKV